MPLASPSLIFSYVLSPSRRDLIRHARAVSILLLLLSTSSLAAAPATTGSIDVSATYFPNTRTLVTDGVLRAGCADERSSLYGELTVDEGVWDTVSIDAAFSSNGFGAESTLRLEPDRLRFKDWKTSIEMTLGASSIEMQHKLTRSTAWLIFASETNRDLLNADARIRLRSPACGTFAFYDARARAEIPFGCALLETEATIRRDGLRSACIEFENLRPASLPWMDIDIELEWTAMKLSLEVDATLSLDSCGSFELTAGSLADGNRLSPLRIEELSFEWKLPDLEATHDIDADIAVSVNVQLDPDDWLDDRFAATASLEGEWSIGSDDRRFSLFLALDWDGVPDDGTADRIRLATEVSLTTQHLLRFEVDADAAQPDLTRLAIGLVFDW